jgi:hypothetical protein
MAKPTTAVAVPSKTLSSDELTALLQQSGWAEKYSGEQVQRLKLDGNMLVTPDGEMFLYNPKAPTVPAMTVRIVAPPEEYWSVFLSEENARLMGRSDIGGQFSKKYVTPDANRKVWPSDEAYNAILAADLFDQYGKPLKASWKADLQLQIIPDDGQLKGDEPIYTLTLSTTSLIEFKGTSKSPEAGSVSPKNFIRKLSEFAMENAPEGTDPGKAVIDALTSLSMGGVAAEVRILRAENKEKGMTWSVVSFDPIHIEPMVEGDRLLGAGDEDPE